MEDATDFQARIRGLEQQLEQTKAKAGPSTFDTYQTPLNTRYCSAEMSKLFSQRSRHSTWRKLWLYLAESERELGIETITPEALEQMRSHLEVSDADFELARVEEKKRRHDVMAHVHAFGAVAPAAAGIIHYGVSIWDGRLVFSLLCLKWLFLFTPTVGSSHTDPARRVLCQQPLTVIVSHRQRAATSLIMRSWCLCEMQWIFCFRSWRRSYRIWQDSLWSTKGYLPWPTRIFNQVRMEIYYDTSSPRVC